MTICHLFSYRLNYHEIHKKKHIICGNGITFVPLHHKKTRNNRHYDTRRTDKNDQ